MPPTANDPSPRAVAPGSVSPPGIRASWRDLLAFRRSPLDRLAALKSQFGDIARWTIGKQEMVLLSRPDLVRDVLVINDWNFKKGRGLERSKRLLGEGLLTSEGELHRRQRRLAQPAFHHERIRVYAETMVDCALRARARWQPGETLDLHRQMMQLTLVIVGKTLFSADVEREAGDVGQALKEIFAQFLALASPFADLVERVYRPRARRFEEARGRLDGIIYRIIDQHRENPGRYSDLLSMLMRVHDPESGSFREGAMSDELLRDEAMTIFIAGHETTANALTWTWYLLSQHPAVEARLHAELHRELGGRAPNIDDLPRLVYTGRVLRESMRLYPPAWIIGRRALTPYQVDGYKAPAGTLLLLSPYLMHRDPRYYPDPEVFEPERWQPEAVAGRPKFSYFPFGAGTRACIGEGFAWTEAVLLVAALGQKWRPRLAPGHPVALEPRITLRPRHGMSMTMEPRG